MIRRSFILGVATAVAGCGGTGSSSGIAQAGDGAEQVGGSSAEVSAFITALEENGVDIDSTMKMAGELSVMYFRRPDHERQDLNRIATTFAEHRGVTDSFLVVTALEPDGASRYGTYQIDRRWARQYARGELSREQYLTNIEATFTEK